MPTSTGRYNENLRTEVRHSRSGSSFVTDAPVDNNGKGEAFSPTDLVAAALGSCMATIMGIWAEKNDVDLSGLHWEITKHMSSNTPRRIVAIDVHMEWPGAHTATDEQKHKLKKAALTCPVAQSLHPDIQQNISFNF
ncbi:OsmC family protein [Cesiribacter andamanensis]|uniref:Peroxiredoxin, Ohr subfamily n=1 Tax=Cesiribacter andamanensis AMV16 TaxID=1279009 RepID=M7MX46_9BACT|nr:OsmC family protein [Cesiribacter andamanensis]EMR01003.1 peroxiredoxin, Ohr subfamily [Cesiribacter andamanensis AMV16]